MARTMAQGVLNTTLATQVAAASQEMTVLWDNLMQSGAAVSRASEWRVEATRGQLLDLLGRQDYAGFLSVYRPFRESALAMVKAAFEGQVSAAMRAAEEGWKARDMGAEDYAAEEYGEASQALEAARAARDAGNYPGAFPGQDLHGPFGGRRLADAGGSGEPSGGGAGAAGDGAPSGCAAGAPAPSSLPARTRQRRRRGREGRSGRRAACPDAAGASPT
ncbi:hypothetical protein HS125_12560 [bacterium]|nr:hypothetical protein [bacterium]